MGWKIENYPSQLFITSNIGSSKFYLKSELSIYSAGSNVVIEHSSLGIIMAVDPSAIDNPSINGTEDIVKLLNGYLTSSSITSSSESAGNTTTTPLGSGATFTGIGDRSDFPDVMVSLKTDNSGTLFFDFSNDGTNWDSTFPPNGFSVTSGIHEFHTAVKGPRYFRVRLVNDTGAQSYLRLYTYFGTFRQGNLPFKDSISDDSDALVTRSDTEEEIMKGRVQGQYIVSKFAVNEDVDAAEDICDVGGDYTGITSSPAEEVQMVCASATDDASGAGARTVRIFYLDENGNMFDSNGDPLYVDVNTNGGTVNTGVTASFVWRAKVISFGANNVNAGTITIRWRSTTTVVFTVIAANVGVSKISAFKIPSGYTGYLKNYSLSMLDSASNSARIAIKVFENGSSGYILTRDGSVSTTKNYTENLYGGVKFLEGDGFVFRAVSIANTNGIITATYGLLLVKN